MQTLGVFLLSCFLIPISFLPLRWSQTLGSWIGVLLIRYNKKRAHIARCNLKVCFPEKTQEQIEELLINTAKESGKWFLESAYVWYRHPNYLCSKVNVTNPELLERAYRLQQGVVIILPHLGNWELLNYYIPQRYPFGAMYRPLNSKPFEKLVFKSRTRVGSDMYPTNQQGVRRALKSLKAGNIVAVLSDHLPSHQACVYAPFFNHPAMTGKLTHSLIKNTKAEVLLASVLRKPNGEGFEISFHPVEGMNTTDSLGAAIAMNKEIEKSILVAPEQYQWVYRRFAHPPPGAKDIYK